MFYGNWNRAWNTNDSWYGNDDDDDSRELFALGDTRRLSIRYATVFKNKKTERTENRVYFTLNSIFCKRIYAQTIVLHCKWKVDTESISSGTSMPIFETYKKTNVFLLLSILRSAHDSIYVHFCIRSYASTRSHTSHSTRYEH